MLPRSVPRAFAGLFVCLTVLLTGCSPTDTSATSATSTSTATLSWVGDLPTLTEAQLPAEARGTLALIDTGGPFPYAKDGAVFGNFERELPQHERGCYHEYTVKTPGERDRGARRIVTGQGGEIYYTDDHYTSFRAVLR